MHFVYILTATLYLLIVFYLYIYLFLFFGEWVRFYIVQNINTMTKRLLSANQTYIFTFPFFVCIFKYIVCKSNKY